MNGEKLRGRNDVPNEIRSEPPDDIVFEEGAPVITEIRNETIPDPKAIEDSPVYEDFEAEAEERMRIQNMSPEETMKYLARSLSEINAPADHSDMDLTELFSGNGETEEHKELPVPPAPQAPAATEPRKLEEYAPTEKSESKPLTVEPIWGDIYIKASRNLRELCESGKLSMKQIETELNEKLLAAAEQFAAVTKDESKVPKVLIPKITELKAAARNFDPYFQAGEDIATRAMFFMLYQMLSYADRIAETPETKENLNDFFRRFGPAGITLSMLDMRV